MCQGFLHAISSLQNTSYQLTLGHLDHVELLIRHVLELQMKCSTKSSSKYVPTRERERRDGESRERQATATWPDWLMAPGREPRSGPRLGGRGWRRWPCITSSRRAGQRGSGGGFGGVSEGDIVVEMRD